MTLPSWKAVQAQARRDVERDRRALRARLAAVALQALIGSAPRYTGGMDEGAPIMRPDRAAEQAIAYADALLAALDDAPV